MEKMKRPLIFVTNDDGFDAKGIAATVEVASKFGEVLVVAPHTAQSGMSHAITMSRPLFLKKIRHDENVEIYSFNGTPVDCVKIAFDSIMLERNVLPDLVISGINHGSNSAINVLYSGTMAAAIEASFYNIPSIGLSLLDHDADADFEASKVIAERIIASIFERKGTTEMPFCMNINIPNVGIDEIKGIKVCRQNKGYWREEFEKRTNPHDQDYYWLKGFFHNTEQDATDTDEWALANNYVSMVPVQVDLTNYKQLKQLNDWEF